MGNSRVKPNVVIDCVIKEIKDYSSNGAMALCYPPAC